MQRSDRRDRTKKNANQRIFRIESLEPRMVLATDIAPVEFRELDGTGNNASNPEWGSTSEELLRLTEPEYADGVAAPAGEDRPSPREISNAIVAQEELTANDRLLSDFIWIWGQFLDHDMDLTLGATPTEPLPIAIPTGDPFFDPAATGTATMSFNRSSYSEESGVREQINQITAFIDGSMVYGSDETRAASLRTFQGGRLKTSEGNLLPFANDDPNSGRFVAGDIRVNENIGLMSMQTLWLREHNRIADEIAAREPNLTDEEIYQRARAIVGAEIQAVTYNEFLPALLGENALSRYEGYDPNVDPGIATEFSTAAFRLGHSLLSPELVRLNESGAVIDEGNLSLREAFFNTGALIETGIDPILRGAATQTAQELDANIIDDVRNFLFGPPGAGGFDLASLNIQRGRDHGLADYNQTRVGYGLDPVTSFAQITSDPQLQAALEATYGTVENIDLWVGGLAEDHLPGASVGELFSTILVDQFERLRDGDRFWYQNVFTGRQLQRIESTTLADVIRRNTGIRRLQPNVFFDDSVLYHEVPPGQQSANTTIVVGPSNVEIVDQRTTRVLARRPVETVARVMLVGANGRADNVTIDVRQARAPLAGGIVVDGGAGPRDVLNVLGTRNADTISVDAERIVVNGTVVFHSEFERIRVEADPRQDNLTIAENVRRRVEVVRPPVAPPTRPTRPNTAPNTGTGSTNTPTIPTTTNGAPTQSNRPTTTGQGTQTAASPPVRLPLQGPAVDQVLAQNLGQSTRGTRR